jgi:hypothetical protein
VVLKAKAIVNNPNRRAKDGADIVSIALRNDLDLGPWRASMSDEEIKLLDELLPR